FKTVSGAFGEGDTVDTNRPRNVLENLLANVLEAEAELVAHLIVNVARNADSTRLGKRLQPCRHVDAVAINIVVVADDVADIDSNAELDAALDRQLGIALDHAALNVDGATDGVDDADELQNHPIPAGLEDSAAMLGDLGIDQFLAMLLQLAKRAFLVGAHQPAVASNVHSQNRGKPPIDASLDHAVFLSGYYVPHQY